jgi:hypothetical protein
LRLTLASSFEPPLYMAPEMDNSADDKAAVGVDSSSLIVSDVFIGDPVFTATTTLPVFCMNVSQGDRPELPESMRH